MRVAFFSGHSVLYALFAIIVPAIALQSCNIAGLTGRDPTAARLAGATFNQSGSDLERSAIRGLDGLKYPYLRDFLASCSEMTNSSIFAPAFSAATSQRGCLPRPDQVSPGAEGLRYFG